MEDIKFIPRNFFFHVTEMLRFFVPQVEDEVDDIAKAEFEKFEQTLKESGKPTWLIGGFSGRSCTLFVVGGLGVEGSFESLLQF